MISQVSKVDNIAHVVGNEFNQIIHRFDGGFVAQSIRFENLKPQHPKQTLETYALLLLIETCDIEMATRLDHGLPDEIRRSLAALTFGNTR